MHSTPFHKQLDLSKLAGQIVNPIGWDEKFQHDAMDDTMSDEAVYRMMHPSPKPGTLGEYIRRKDDNQAGMPVSEGEAFCSRIMR